MAEEEHKGQPGSSTEAAALEKAGIETLKASLRGELFQPGDAGYDAVRRDDTKNIQSLDDHGGDGIVIPVFRIVTGGAVGTRHYGIGRGK